MKELAVRVADLMVGAQAARTSGSHATADDLSQKANEAIQEGNLRGEITDLNGFHKELANQIVARHAARLSDALGLSDILKNK